ncbi:MAG: TROVE domain-containing protein [Bacteroidales bacterium]|nr:TROVE domain-containing protein [Bacteroidales bacterium]
MSFNSMLREQSETKNYEGEKAYVMSPEMELYTAVVATALSNNFYEDKSGRIERIAELVKQVPHEFTAKLAVYTRNEMNLRSVPLLLIVELAKIHNGDNLVARAVEKCVLRADEIMELLMCYQVCNPQDGEKKLKKLSRQIQNGLQKAFNRFDEYQFAKYNRDNLEVKLRDALFLVHPKAKDDAQQLIFNKITDRKLETPYTWETELSALGQQKFETPEQKTAAFRQKWEELIISGRLGYMALMRNLRNIFESKVSAEKINIVASILSDADQVAKSKQLPFRYLSAYRELQKIDSPDTPFLMSALELAVKHSAANIEGFDADTSVLLACDVSGSMCHPISPRSTVECYDIGLMLAMLLKSRCRRVVSGIFGDRWKAVNMPSDNILQSATELRKLNGKVGYSTNGFKVIDYLVENKIIIDKVMFFTDCQLWNSTGGNTSIERSWNRYRQIAPNAKLYFFDLAGYGQSPLKIINSGVYLIGGWSDKVFDILSALEKGESAVEVIKAVEVYQ